MFEKREIPYTKRHHIPFTTYQVLLWHYLGLDVLCIFSTEELKSNEDIMAAETALDHQFLEQNYDEHRLVWSTAMSGLQTK